MGVFSVPVVDSPLYAVPMPDREELLSVGEAAKQLGVSARTIRRYISEGRLPAVRVGPKMLRVRATDLDRIITPEGEE